MEKQTGYVTSDGQFFEDQIKAMMHQRRINFTAWYNKWKMPNHTDEDIIILYNWLVKYWGAIKKKIEGDL